MSKNPKHAVNPFEPPSLADSDQVMYGTLPALDTGRMVAQSIPITHVTPDVTQPRRVIPALIRASWTGDADDTAPLLADWRTVVESRINAALDIPDLLRGATVEEWKNHPDPVVAGFFDTVALASSIYRDGLINPIRVARTGARYTIESGERRWVAHYLLLLHIDDAKDTIPAFVKSRVDVWAQAAENGQRSPLNAIGMARQLAKLIMDMYPEETFSSYHESDSDRAFFAQVANGNLYRIKKGLMERVLEVTGLKNYNQVSQYRALLDIPDEVWNQADDQNWTENFIREYIRAAKLSEAQDDTLTVVKVSQDETYDAQPDVNMSDAAASDTAPTPLDHIDPETGEITRVAQQHLTDAARAFLERAYRQRKNFPASEGWMPIPVFNRAEVETLKQAGCLEARMTARLPGKPPQEEVRITPLGCEVLDAAYPTTQVAPPPAPPPSRPAAPPSKLPPHILRESTQPLLDTYDSRIPLETLRFLKRMSVEPSVTVRLMDLMTVSRANIAEEVRAGGVDGWSLKIHELHDMIQDEANRALAEVALYLEWLLTLGKEAAK